MRGRARLRLGRLYTSPGGVQNRPFDQGLGVQEGWAHGEDPSELDVLEFGPPVARASREHPRARFVVAVDAIDLEVPTPLTVD